MSNFEDKLETDFERVLAEVRRAGKIDLVSCADCVSIEGSCLNVILMIC